MAKKIKQIHISNLRYRTDIKKRLMIDFRINNIESIRRWIRANRPNGPLTSKSSLKILAIGLSVSEKELLEEFDNEPYPINNPKNEFDD